MIRILFSEEMIASRVKELGKKISEDYEGKDLTVIALLNGGLPFAADLIRNIHVPMYLDSFAASSYVNDCSSRKLTIRSQLKNPIEGRDILLVDDILDTGCSLAATIAFFREKNPRSIRSCVLLDKKLSSEKKLKADYCGFEVEDLYVVGYGLDSCEFYRNLPYIGVLEEK